MSARPHSFAVAAPRPGARALALAALCLAALVLVYLLATRVPAVRARDAAALNDLAALATPGLETWGGRLLRLLEPEVFVFWAAAIVLLALARGRPRAAAAAAAVTALAPLTAELLKPALAHPHLAAAGAAHVGPASWPSGHAAAAASLAIAAVIATPRRLRPPLALAAAALAALVGVLLVVLGWHMPTDVLGGWLLAGAWGALAVALARPRPTAA